jgi:aspartate 1-decarboxylase
MMINVLSGKINRISVTDIDNSEEASISIDEKLMEMAGIAPFQQVQVINLASGETFRVFATPAKKASGTVQINGGLSSKAKVGDNVQITTYCAIPAAMAQTWTPQEVSVDSKNRPIHSIDKDAESFLDARRRRKGAA